MNTEHSFTIRFSGITVRFVLPTTVNLQECFTNLMCEDTTSPDAEYRVELLTSPLCPQGEPCATLGHTYVYKTNEGCLHIYSPLTAEDGCQVACLLSKNGRHTMYYPASKWAKHRKYWHCSHLLCGEAMLMMFGAVLLHSSLVKINGKMVLFSGKSGDGKSTQAELWRKHADAEIINGDRTVIRKIDGVFCGGGSLWCGTSGINKGDIAPIGGIFILKKSSENKVRRLSSEAFMPLFSQTTINSWDKEFVDKATDIYRELIESVPIYELSSTADKNAVELAYKTIFGEELSCGN